MNIRSVVTMKRYAEIPDVGLLMAVLDDKVIFTGYRKGAEGLVAECSQEDTERDFSSLSCFDDSTEYRLISINNGEQLIESVADARQEQELPADLIYVDEMLIDPIFRLPGKEKLYVVNRYRYTDYDTLSLESYRLTTIDPMKG